MKKTFVKTIRRVEDAFWTIVFSARKQVGNRGVLLPMRFNSIRKIKRFLAGSMTPCLANRLIRNLQLRRIGGRLAIPLGDGIGAPPIRRVQVLSRTNHAATVAVWFSFDKSDRFFRVYQLCKQRGTGRWIVYGRHPLDFPFN